MVVENEREAEVRTSTWFYIALSVACVSLSAWIMLDNIGPVWMVLVAAVLMATGGCLAMLVLVRIDNSQASKMARGTRMGR